MIDRLYEYRFELFLSTQILILFGTILIPLEWFEAWIMPILLLCNIASGILLIKKKKHLFRLFIVFFVIAFVINITGFLDRTVSSTSNYIKLASYFIFYSIVTIEIIHQVWKAKVVGKNVILGLISGFISLGLLSFFLCLTIEIFHPHSFSGFANSSTTDMPEQLMYYSYITLMTIGYGDILPVTPIAQKAAVFIGLIGQFYLVILTAIVVGKYINQSSYKN